jgi:uncharacterized protein (TIGR03437 family)
LASVRDNLVALVNQDPVVSAEPSGEFTRLILRAKLQGPAGNSITYGASASASATLVMSAFYGPNGSTLCCGNVAGAPVTVDNPAAPGEFIIVQATGLGIPVLNDTIQSLIVAGVQYPLNGPVTTPPAGSDTFVSALAGGSTADVISATLQPGTVGVFEVILHLNSGISSNATTSLTIAQSTFVSKAITFPVLNPAAPAAAQ